MNLSLRRQGLIQVGRDGLEEGEAAKLEMWKIKAGGRTIKQELRVIVITLPLLLPLLPLLLLCSTP